jgi:anti-anti-sigma regulatory factor
VTACISGGLELEVERGPNWLFVKLHASRCADEDVPHLADELWSIMSRHFIYRLVLELDEWSSLSEELMAQLMLVRHRVLEHGGSLRLCGLSPRCERAFKRSRLGDTTSIHPTRETAVMGSSDRTAAVH